MKLFIKLFIFLLLSISSFFIIYSFIIIRYEKKNLEEDLVSKINYNKKIYAPSVSALLYEYNKNVLNSLLKSIYIDKEIVKIELKDITDHLNILLNSKEFDKSNIIKSTISLTYNSEKIGDLDIYYTKDNIDLLLNYYKNTIITFSIILLLISIIIYYLISKKLTSSLEYLSYATDNIAAGDLNKPIIIDTNDEIGLLGKKFEKMRVSLNKREELNNKQNEEIKTLNEEMITTQKKLIEILGEVIEKRYIDDPNHIKRVAQTSYMLAIKMGMSEEEAQTLKAVSPMHDVGKIGIPDSILLKPGKLTEDEFELMKEHSRIGYDFLKNTGKKTLDMAATVAYEHHEKWNGTGYPRGLKEEEISLEGRITALADVFDALANKRCYKEAWKIEEIIKYLKEQKTEQFDPKLVDLFIENIDTFLDIQKQYQ